MFSFVSTYALYDLVSISRDYVTAPQKAIYDWSSGESLNGVGTVEAYKHVKLANQGLGGSEDKHEQAPCYLLAKAVDELDLTYTCSSVQLPFLIIQLATVSLCILLAVASFKQLT